MQPFILDLDFYIQKGFLGIRDVDDWVSITVDFVRVPLHACYQRRLVTIVN